jgi:hypothetical protein
MRIPWKTMGQASEEWMLRAQAAVSEFEGLFSRVERISDANTRGAIIRWIGMEDMPGSPAERYKVVRMDLAEAEAGILAAVASDITESRVSQLEAITVELYSKIASAEEAYGATPAPADAGAGFVPGTRISRSGFFAGSIGLLALVAVPFLVD